MGRSAYGSGNIRKLPSGRYQLRISLGVDPLTGTLRRVSKTVDAASATDARKQLAAFMSSQHSERDASTFGGLLNEYLAAAVDMSPSTRIEAEGMIARYIPVSLLARPLKMIGSHDLDRLYAHLRKQGGVCQQRPKCEKNPCKHGAGAPLSAATVDRLHTTIRAALEQGYKWDYLTENPAAKTRRIPIHAKEVQLPPAEHLVTLLAKLDKLELDGHDQPGSVLPDFVALLVATGARPGEICALSWGNVDLDREDKEGNRYGVITIAHAVARAKGTAIIKGTKTNKVRRVTIVGPVVDALAARRARWMTAALAAGVPLEELSVFPSRDTIVRPWRPDAVSKEFRLFRDELGLSDSLTLRNLRHHAVSVLAAAGVDVVTVAKRMGHSPQIMLTVYAHLFEEADLDAAGILGKQLAR